MTCTICDSPVELLFDKVVDHMVSKESFKIYRCKNCDTLSTLPIPEDLSRYYDSNDYLSHHSNHNNIQSTIYRFIRSININNKINILNSYSQGKTLLDIGCGTGDFLVASKNKHYQVEGLEVDKDAATVSQSRIGKNIFTKLDQINQTFDAVTLWHVLEHLPDPSDQLKKIHSLLKDKAICIIAVPNYKSEDAKYYKSLWAGYDVPRHLFHFSQKSITYLAKRNKFSVEATHPMPFDAYYVSLLSEKYKSPSILNYINAFSQGLQSNFSARTTKQYSSLIYILRKK